MSVRTRGARHIFWLPLHARGDDIGTVTLLRGEDDPWDAEEIDRLALLATQLAIAVQNARDYRDKLELATRDPLTGIHNRRFFYEALETEVSRTRALRLARVAGDLRHRRLQEHQRPLRPRRRRRRAAHGSPRSPPG